MRHTVASFAAMLHQEGLVIIGETHGTNEFPRLVWELAFAALESGPVRMAIEQDAGGQGELDRFMDSDGGQLATDRLLSADVWHAGDGRGSLAVLDLIDRCRRLRAAGLPMDVRLVDMGLGDLGMGPSSSTRRDQVIAERLAAECSSSAAVVALLGSVHARLDAHLGSHTEPGFRPAAAILRRQMPVFSLLGVHGGGTAWCIRMHDSKPLSGAHLFRGRELGPEPFFELASSEPGYDGVAYVPSITASAPAIHGPNGSV